MAMRHGGIDAADPLGNGALDQQPGRVDVPRLPLGIRAGAAVVASVCRYNSVFGVGTFPDREAPPSIAVHQLRPVDRNCGGSNGE